MKVLSLFDGMSCGRIALNNLGIPIDRYYASEIEQSSIKIALKNFPDTIQLGDVREVTSEVLDEIGEVDLLIGGSPCRNLSKSIYANKNAERGIVGESLLFYEYVRIFEYIKPKYFLFENVESMDNKDKDIISDYLGVKPIMIDSNLFSAQDRKRYYWTNIPIIEELPKRNDTMIVDIIEDNVPEKYFYKQDYEFLGYDKKVIAKLNVNTYDMLKRVYNLDSKCATLTSCRGGYKQKKVMDNGRVRKLTPLEYERLQTVPDGYTSGVADKNRYNMLGDGWTVSVIEFIFKFLVDKYKK
jgi:DNA-cytosine methyltransferase